MNQTIIPIDWDQIEKDPRHRSNIVLQAGDKIQVADYDGSVKVSGNVVLMSEIPFHKGKGFAYYFNAVGGVDDKGWKKKSYIVYPNGKAATTSSFLFFTSYPKVIAGSQIIVPEKPERQKMTTGEWVSIGSVITSLALLVVTAFK